MTVKVFILSKQTCGYDVKNMSAQDSIGLHVIFNEYISSAFYLLGTHDNISFYEFPYSVYISINYTSLRVKEMLTLVLCCVLCVTICRNLTKSHIVM